MRRPSDMGNGSWCPVEGHGRMYGLDDGRQWCPHSDHDERGSVPSFYAADGKTPAARRDPDAPIPVKSRRS